MVAKTQAEQRVLDAVREWMAEREPVGNAEKELFVAAARCWPEDIKGKEACDCGEVETCDECLSSAQIETGIRRLEDELGL